MPPAINLLETGVWLFWTFAELAILLLVRGWLMHLEGRPRPQSRAMIAASALWIGMAVLGLGWSAMFGSRLAAWSPVGCLLFDCALWDFGATLWVAIELVILVYVVRLDGMLHGDRPSPADLQALRAIAGLLVLGCCAVYALFVHQLVRVSLRHGLSSAQIESLSVFYLKACGVVWILVEGAYAVYAVRCFRCLRNRQAGRTLP